MPSASSKKKIQGSLTWLWISILIFAASNAVVAKIGKLGATHLIHGHNPISFCNLLFAGNLIAGLTLLIIYRKNWHPSELKKYPFKDWLCMFALILMSGVIAPALFFISLMITEVTNVVLISTLDVPLSLLFAYLLFREKTSVHAILGALVVFAGIVLIFLLKQPSMHRETVNMLNLGSPAANQAILKIPKAGEIFTGIATLLGVIAVQISRKLLQRVPLGVFTVVRMIAGVILFSIIVLFAFGPHHFDQLLSPFLWRWMLAYGAIIIVLGQITWFKGLQRATSADISTASALTPIAGTLFAFLLLGETPNFSQILGGVIILLGIAISLFGVYSQQKRQAFHKKPSSFSGV